MSAPYRSAVIGCGFIGTKISGDPQGMGVQSHAHAYAACSETALVGLCDPSLTALGLACEQWPFAHGYDDLEQMLSEQQPDIVSVCTPDETHYCICEQLLGAPSVKAIIVEKPIATDLTDARRFLVKAKERNVAVLVNYSRRYAESHALIKKKIDHGVIGEILAIHGAYSKGIIHNGSHWFDLVRWLVGEIATIEAWQTQVTLSNDPTCHVRIGFENGIQGFLMGIDAKHFSIFELDIIGVKGRVQIRESGHAIALSLVQDSPYYPGYRALGKPDLQLSGFKDVALQLVKNATQVLTYKQAPICSGVDGLAALTISLAACQSLQEKCCIKINY